MRIGLSAALTPVHCRVGSLEKIRHELQHRNPVHCRVGSLETDEKFRVIAIYVHCRVGSLENTRPNR